ncbi:MAG: amidohydrolase [Candidatus Cloacimonetes bacterium]|nr:amidohydrolase [Candidatus Cloacimonadota bacterium]
MDLIKIRRELHKIPELGFEEVETQNYILQTLKDLKGLEIHTFSFPGILVEYSHGEGEYKLFRADMDGLPITEETDCGYESEHNGLMHACGHDMHMTILIGLIDKVIKHKFNRNLLFLFQPAEEGRGGAERILQTRMLNRFPISEVYALHVNGDYLTGEIASRPGIFFANTQEIEVVFKGKSAHVAFAEKGVNALKAGIEFYLELERIIKTEFPDQNQVICAFGKMQAGVVMNAVPAECRLEGTFRAFNNEDHNKLKDHIEAVKSEICQKCGVKGEIIYKAYYKEVVNDAKLFQILKSKATETSLKLVESDKVLTGEDFGFLTDKYRGLLFWLGAGNREVEDLHSPKFLPDDKALSIGVNLFFDLIS